MWIKTIQIAGFGQFVNQQWTLEPGVQVIYGQNEAGKSTLRQFILSLLFGFPTRRHPVERYEPRQTAQYGGSLIFETQTSEYRLKRVGNQVELYNLTTDQAEPISVLEHLLGGLDRQLFQQIYAFNQLELQQIGQLRPADLNRQLQQIGATGSQEWVPIQQMLQKTADELYRPKAQVLPLNLALKHYQELQQQLSVASGSYQDYQIAQERLSASQAELRHTEETIIDRQKRLTRLADLSKQWAIYQQYQQLKRPTATIDEISPLVQKKLRSLIDQATQLQTNLKNTQSQLNQQQVTSVNGDQVSFYTQNADHFDRLFKQLPIQQQKLGQLGGQQDQLAQLTQTQTDQLQKEPAIGRLRQASAEQLAAWQSDLTHVSRSQETRQTRQATQQTLSPKLITGGAIVLIGLLLPVAWLKIVLVLVGLGVGWWGYSNPNKTATITDPLAKWVTAWQLRSDQADLTSQQHLLSDWRAYQQREQAKQTLQAEIQQTTTELSQAIEAYQFASAWLPLNQRDLVGAFQQIEQFRQQVQTAKSQQSTQMADWRYLQSQVKQLEASLAANQQAQQDYFNQVGVIDLASYQEKLAAQTTSEQLVSQADHLKQQLSGADYAELQQYPDFQALATAKRAAQNAFDQAQAARQKLVTQVNQQQQQLIQLTSNGTYDQLQQQVSDQLAKVSQLAQRWLTTELTAQWIQKALNQASSARLPLILTQAKGYFSQLTEQRYNEISLVDGGITATTSRTQQTFSVAELSTGTAEQLYLALRLAMIAVLDLPLPIMIDDGLVNFDDSRKQAAWQLLNQVSQQHQVLYFTNETTAKHQFNGAKVLDLTDGGSYD